MPAWSVRTYCPFFPSTVAVPVSWQDGSCPALAVTAFLVAWIFYGGLWLTRVVPRYRELPAFVDKFPGVLDFAFWAVMAAALAYAVFG